MGVKKNYIYNFSNQLISIIIPIITMPYVSRVLGPEGIGENTFTNTYVQYFILLGMLGLATYANREIAYVRDDEKKLKKTFCELTILKFITVGIAIILYLLIFLVINKKDRLIYAIQGLNILASAVDISWYFMGMENFKTIVQRNILVKVIGTALIFLLVKNSNQVWLYILILSTTCLFSQLFLWIKIPVIISIKGINKIDLWRHLINSFKLLIPQLAVQVYTLFDKTLLGLYKGNAQVGIYDNSQKLILLSLTLLTSLSTVMMPYMSNEFAKGNIDSFKESLKKSFSFITLMSIPIAFGIVAIANNLVPWFFGEAFLHVKILLYIETWMIIPIAWSSVLGYQVLIPMKKEHYYSISVTVAAIVDFCLDICFIPKYGNNAAAFATVIAESTGTIIQLYFLRDFIHIKGLFTGIYKNLIASAVMFTLIIFIDKFLRASIVTTFIEIFIGGVAYIAIMLLFRDKTLKFVFSKMKFRT